MLEDEDVCVVMSAHKAETTLERTVAEVRRPLVDDTILVHDRSRANTTDPPRALGLHVPAAHG